MFLKFYSDNKGRGRWSVKVVFPRSSVVTESDAPLQVANGLVLEEILALFRQTHHNVITVVTLPYNLKFGGYAMDKQLRARDIKIIPIGNSFGVRLPKTLLNKYGLTGSLVLEETDQGLLLRKKHDDKLSWDDTYKAMAKEDEDWSDYDATLLDGLEDEDIDKS